MFMPEFETKFAPCYKSTVDLIQLFVGIAGMADIVLYMLLLLLIFLFNKFLIFSVFQFFFYLSWKTVEDEDVSQPVKLMYAFE